jgi:adenine-specific DNA-methyltransferase
MSNIEQLLTKQEIQLLENLGLDPNSKNLSQKIQDVLKKGEIEKFVDYDQGGISKAVSWQGGGDFIYCELAKYNETFIEKIQKLDIHGDTVVASTELLKIWEEMKEKAFLDYRVETAKFDSEEFKNLSIEEQKTLLVEVLDKNQLYVNYTEMEDETYGISQEDRDLNKEFYGK